MTERDIPGVIAPPPLIFLAGLLIGFGLDYLFPYPLLPNTVQYWVGGVLIVVSILLVLPAFREFRRAGTAVNPRKSTTAVITGGTFRFTRNPLYVALAMLIAGVAVAADSVFVLAMLYPVLLVIRYGVIAREERYLEAKFGQAYMDYQARVRRWL